MSREFDGKVALVAGGASGMGLATARLLASRGAAVAILDISDGSALASVLADEFKVKALAIQVNLTNGEAVQRAVTDVTTWGSRLDFGVNAAGIFVNSGHLSEVPTDAFRKVMDVNVTGVFHCIREEIRAFQRLEIRGSIVNITSDAGTVATAGCSAYVASKHALVGLTKTAALEYARSGIRVNAVAPGDVATPMALQFTKDSGETLESMGAKHPVGRVGKPEEVAELICFLLSDRAPFITGANVAIDGGITTSGFYKLD